MAARRELKHRFTFFQRQFLSHLLVSLLILALLSSALSYYLQQYIYTSKTDELNSVSKAIVKLLSQQTEDPYASLQAFRILLAERKISFIMLDKSGEIVYRDRAGGPTRSRKFLDSLRAHMQADQGLDSFTISTNTDEPLVVVPRMIKLANGQSEEGYLFVVSPLLGIQQTLQTLNKAMLYLVLFVFVLAVAVSGLISRSMSRSILSLRATTRQLAAGNYAARSGVSRTDELGELASDFNSMAERLEATSHKLERFEQRRRQFVMDVTHELRTPLTSIRGITEALKNHMVDQPEDRDKYYDIIEKETFRLIRLINELLDTEKIESGMVTLHKKIVPLRELFDIVAESLDVLIEKKHLQISIDCPDDLVIYGDYDRLTQILINLVKNSIQFTDSGTIRLKGSETDTHTRIEISDTGRGMTAEEQALIWERFYKADPARSKLNSETGLGLSIVKQLVEAHKGTITVESEPGSGSTFTILTPKPVPDEEKDKPRPPRRPGETRGGHAKRGRSTDR